MQEILIVSLCVTFLLYSNIIEDCNCLIREAKCRSSDSSNLPKIDVVMLGAFLATNTNFCSAEFRNIKTSVPSRASYGDDAISYVQLKWDGKCYSVKYKICPEHKVKSKLYTVTLIVDEENDIIRSIESHDCVASQGKRVIAFLMWVIRRSEEPACTSTERHICNPSCKL